MQMNTKHPTGASMRGAPAAMYFDVSSNFENTINAAFVKFQLYDKDLGFYLMP
jgi:hypothetical protein